MSVKACRLEMRCGAPGATITTSSRKSPASRRSGRPGRRSSQAGAYDAPLRYPRRRAGPRHPPARRPVQHVNGRWLERTRSPPAGASDSTFRILADQAEEAVHEIAEQAVSAPEGSEERKFGDLYASFMDTGRAELLGAQSWWPTSWRPTARASGSLTGWGHTPAGGPWTSSRSSREDRLPDK